MADSCLLALIFGAVESEGPQKFGRKAKDMPIGVDSVNYRIEIKECNSFSITLDEFRQRIISE